MSKRLARKVARAIAKVNPFAGQPYKGTLATLKVRTDNLLRDTGPYGAYVVSGDPHGWSHGALVTIYMEQRGTPDDVIVPMDYYDGGDEVASKASDLLASDGVYIEFVNAAVAAVHRV